MKSSIRWGAVTATILCCVSALPQGTTRLTFLSTGAMPKAGFYRPQRLKLTSTRSPLVKRAPAGLKSPLYGVLTLGDPAKPTKFAIVLSGSKLYVDANANGDLTDDPAPVWQSRQYGGERNDQYTMYSGGATVQVRYGAVVRHLHLGMYAFDPKDPQRAEIKDTLLYYRDYAAEGEVELGGEKYRVMLSDESATGAFSHKSGMSLMIDVNKNGRFDSRGEIYAAGKPFNLKGTTYEVKSIGASGDTVTIVKSSQQVAEILPPPDLGAGKPAIPFTAQTTAGQTIHFPSSYRGKIVLLDFWATWCGPCRAELPHLTKAYETYHERGFEVLGISLDQKGSADKLAQFTQANKMPWMQVYDGKFWEAEIAQLYAVDSIPRAYLVDGDTGEILASGESLRGESLAKTIENALSKKGK